MNVRPHPQMPAELAAFVAAHFSDRQSYPDELIAQSWYRSVTRHGLDPARSVAHVRLEQAEIRQHQAQHHDYLTVARQGVEGLARRLNPAGFAVLLSDQQGVTLDARVPGGYGAFDDSGLVIGSCWDETIVGTNGIGTGLMAQEPLIIHRDEHFLTSNFRLSCSVAPLFDPQGALMGCLNASCLNSEGPKQAQFLTLQLVSLYARLIENASFRHRFADSMVLTLGGREDDLGNEQLLALDPGGRVLGANRAAFSSFGRGQPLQGLALDALLPVTLERLLSLTQGGARSAKLPLGSEPTPVEITLRLPAAAGDTGRKASAPTAPPSQPSLEQLAGGDRQLQKGVQRIRRVLGRDIAILITGETGTGKEAFARGIHHASARSAGPFVALNCAAIPESLIESELFGYRGGSFTGANRHGMKGKLHLANGGTLFLDEIGDMPAHLQTRLLRVLAEREIHPLGAEAPVSLDVQLVCATHRDLPAMVGRGEFREDLYYRLNGLTLALPALRERADREELIRRILLQEAGSLLVEPTAEAMARLIGYAWPGNVRQLINVLRCAVALADDGVIDLDCLPPELTVPGIAVASGPVPALTRKQAEARHLSETLAAHGWNVSAAAVALGLDRSTLYRKIKRYGLSGSLA